MDWNLTFVLRDLFARVVFVGWKSRLQSALLSLHRRPLPRERLLKIVGFLGPRLLAQLQIAQGMSSQAEAQKFHGSV